jgi:hypothetical protein
VGTALREREDFAQRTNYHRQTSVIQHSAVESVAELNQDVSIRTQPCGQELAHHPTAVTSRPVVTLDRFAASSASLTMTP